MDGLFSLPQYSSEGQSGAEGHHHSVVCRESSGGEHILYLVRSGGERFTQCLGFLLFAGLLFGCYLAGGMVLFL